MFKRYAKMAKAFTKLGREIVIAVKAGGPHPESNPRLRMIIQNAKAINMPKVNVESAIKRASEKDSAFSLPTKPPRKFAKDSMTLIDLAEGDTSISEPYACKALNFKDQ